MELVKVYWVDSNMFHEQLPTDTKWHCAIIETVGYLVQKTPDIIVVARDLINEEVRGTITIPMFSVTKIKKLK